MFDALVAGRLKSPVVECEVLQSPPQLVSLHLRMLSPEQFMQAVAALGHTSSFWDVADVVRCSARHLPGRTSLPPRAATRAMRVHRESVEFDPVLDEAVPGRIAILRGLHAPTAPCPSGIRCWAAFADACGWPHFPTPHRVAAWAAVFRSGATFTQYISALRFGCRLSDGDTSWSDSFVAAAARGLRRADVVPAARCAFASSDVEKLVRICDAESAAAMALGYLLGVDWFAQSWQRASPAALGKRRHVALSVSNRHIDKYSTCSSKNLQKAPDHCQDLFFNL